MPPPSMLSPSPLSTLAPQYPHVDSAATPSLHLANGGKNSAQWDKWHVFYADECIMPLDHKDSNHKLARDTLFCHL
ncbi:hypothetical protein BC827DRAFT_1274848 [Russula dissimulans]|nr:hypothetical protein BC827DRAFT_1274848 [Russula dissimulans]